MSILENDLLGAKSIESVKPSDAKEWAVRMHEKGHSYTTINNFKRSLKASFYTAIEDDLIHKNPFNFVLNTILNDDTEPKKILTAEQVESLISFAQNDAIYNKYVDEIIILLGTGIRISELCGLTISDIDFEKRLINIDHQLLKDKSHGYYISTPKTKSGIRQIPMSQKVFEALERSVANCQTQPEFVSGYRDFLFLKKKGTPKTGSYYNGILKNLVKKYNRQHDKEMLKVTPHIFRHTFCTNMANAGMNPKALQYIMGHSDISMTLNYYTHADFNSARAEMERLIV